MTGFGDRNRRSGLPELIRLFGFPVQGSGHGCGSLQRCDTVVNTCRFAHLPFNFTDLDAGVHSAAVHLLAPNLLGAKDEKLILSAQALHFFAFLREMGGQRVAAFVAAPILVLVFVLVL